MRYCTQCSTVINNRGFCYNGHFNPGTATKVVDNTVPFNHKLSQDRKEWLRERLQLEPEEDLIFPCLVRETPQGVLFMWGNDYWQHRLDSPPTPDLRYITCTNPKKEVFPAITESKNLVVVEGIFDALALYREGISSVAMLTTLPRVIDLEHLKPLYDRVFWMPDGDVSYRYKMEGLQILGLLWDSVTGIPMDIQSDPCSLNRTDMKILIDMFEVNE